MGREPSHGRMRAGPLVSPLMELRHLGHSGLAVSNLALGTMSWGQDTDEDDAADQVRVYVEAGGNFIDTADVYAGGKSEEILGRLCGSVVDRDDVYIATKAATYQKSWPGRAPLVTTEVEYSLLMRDIETEIVPAAMDLGLGILPWSPLGRGVLTGKYRGGTPADSRGASPQWDRFVKPYLDERANGIVGAVMTAADGLGVAPVAIALAWVRDRPGVVAPIVGARTAAQLRGSLSAATLLLPDEIRDALDEVSTPA